VTLSQAFLLMLFLMFMNVVIIIFIFVILNGDTYNKLEAKTTSIYCYTDDVLRNVPPISLIERILSNACLAIALLYILSIAGNFTFISEKIGFLFIAAQILLIWLVIYRTLIVWDYLTHCKPSNLYGLSVDETLILGVVHKTGVVLQKTIVVVSLVGLGYGIGKQSTYYFASNKDNGKGIEAMENVIKQTYENCDKQVDRAHQEIAKANEEAAKERNLCREAQQRAYKAETENAVLNERIKNKSSSILDGFFWSKKKDE
jgi:hypothetical protein